MQIEAHNYKWYLKEYHDIEKHDQKNLDVLSPIIVLVHEMKWAIFVKWFTITKMES
jgi:hypothetical protein